MNVSTGLISILITMYLILCTKTLAQQPDLSGTWYGGLSQEDKTWVFDMTLDLKQTGNSITGTAKYEAKDGSGAYALFGIKGLMSNNGLECKLNDVSVLRDKESWYWCKKLMFGTVEWKSDSIVLSGYWHNSGDTLYHNGYFDVNFPYQCYPGYFRVAKYQQRKADSVTAIAPNPINHLKDTLHNTKFDSAFSIREIKVEKTIDVISDSLLLSFYDDGQIDNDTITVYFNKQVIINKEVLSGKRKPLIARIFIPPNSSNQLVMYADNLGSIPPNTAILIFDNKIRRNEVNLHSNKGVSGSIIITRH